MTYRGILHGDRIEWLDQPPMQSDGVHVVVNVAAELPKREPGALAAALRELAELNPFREIADPVAWQREIRQDRPLPGRE